MKAHNTKKIVKKHPQKFKRFQSDRFMRVGTSWRRCHGIDNRVRRKFKGAVRAPKIGYGSCKSTRYLQPDGFRKFTVTNAKDIELLLMHNRTYSAEIAHNISARKRAVIVARAAQLGVKVTNAHARIRQEQTTDTPQ